jgi:hypothetical protein
LVTVTPQLSRINTLQTQQFSATVQISGNTAVTWDVDGIVGGNSTVGTISSGGRYSPPPQEGTHTITATSVADPDQSGSTQVMVEFLSGMLTYHNDNARTGQNLNETVLTPANVDPATFGKLFSYAVDGYVYAQPLYVSDVPIGGQLHNVVIVATQHDSVYAFDADNRTTEPLWHTSFIDPANGVTTVSSGDVSCTDIIPEIGITSTPVVDPVTGSLYVVAKTNENGIMTHRIHVLDITTGAAKPGSGVAIQPSVPGSADPNDGNGLVLFDSHRELQRAALLLNDNVLYVAFASHCDSLPTHGWIAAYDARTLAMLAALNVTPDGEEGGIWHSGGGPAADAAGNVFVVTGDGTFDASEGGNNYGDSILKLDGQTLAVLDYFTPHDQLTLAGGDLDLGSGGPVLLPDQVVGPEHLLIMAGKAGTIYLVDRNNMGHIGATSDDQIVQSLPNALGSGFGKFFGLPTFFGSSIYFVGKADTLKAFTFTDGQLSASPAAETSTVFGFPGGTPAVSAEGSANGIVWVLQNDQFSSSGPTVLHAYDATNVAVELYNSGQNASRDYAGPAVKFTVPTVANGKVYVGTQDRLTAFGLLP